MRDWSCDLSDVELLKPWWALASTSDVLLSVLSVMFQADEWRRTPSGVDAITRWK